MLTENERKVLTEWSEFVKRVPPSIEGLRTNYEKWSEEQNKDLPQIKSYEEGVTLRPGLTADVAVPKGPGPHPVLLYLHGGGWVAGSARTHKKVAAELAARGYLTFNLDYRLAPEYQFPAGLVDCVFAANGFPRMPSAGTEIRSEWPWAETRRAAISLPPLRSF